MPKRSRSAPPALRVTIHVNSIHNYFAPGASSSTSSAETPAPLFATEAERCKRVSVALHGKPCLLYAYFSATDGTLKGGCLRTCNNRFVDIDNFAPTDPGKQTKFAAAYAAYKAAYTERDLVTCTKQRDIIASLRVDQCVKCREKATLSPAVLACKEWWNATRRAMATQHDGCQNPNCPERGAHVWQIITGDHGTNPKKRDAKGRLVSLSSYMEWSTLGGVPAMIEESAQIEKWICHFCHRLEPTSSSGKRCSDPATLSTGVRSDTKEGKKHRSALKHAVVCYPKQQYVDSIKRRVGCCARCKRPVVAGQETAFDWNHIDPSTKCKGGIFGQQGGVGGLVAHDTLSATLDKVKDTLDAEIDKCELLCCNCHVRHTWGYEPSQTVY